METQPIPIRHLVTGPCPGYKTCRIEVGVYHTYDPQERLDVVAKFRAPGSAYLFAQQVARGNIWYREVVIRVNATGM